jgi:CheY-like chemotaxis protein
MLIDDNKDDNFFHERVIRKNFAANTILVKQSASDALEYFKQREFLYPDLIFLDINMPAINGWEFLEEYERRLNDSATHPIIIMLTTSENTDDRARAFTYKIVSEYKTKPLTKDMLEEILNLFF